MSRDRRKVKKYRERLEKSNRTTLVLKITSVYRTVATDASLVIAATQTIEFQKKKRSEIIRKGKKRIELGEEVLKA